MFTFDRTEVKIEYKEGDCKVNEDKQALIPIFNIKE